MSSLRPNELAALKAAQERGGGPASGVIESDRTCLACGYQLRGLPIGGECPECGLSTSIPESIDDPLSLAPITVIRRLKWGCWSVFWCMVLVYLLGVAYSWGRIPEAMVISAAAAVSLSWQAAIRLATPAIDLPQAMVLGFSPRGRLRFAAQWLQLGWPLAAAMALMDLALTTPTPRDALIVQAMRGGVAAGVLGCFCFTILYERLANWTRDQHARIVFNGLTWGLPLVLIGLLWRPGQWWLALALQVITLVTLIVLPLGMLMLARSVGFTVHHAVEYELRTERQKDRRDRFFRNVVDTYVDATAESESPAEADEIKMSDPGSERTT